MCVYREKTESATRVEVDRAHTLFVMRTVTLVCKLLPSTSRGGRWGPASLGGCKRSLTSIVMGLMSYASLVSCEGAANALSREGCRHFETFDQSNEDFDVAVFQVEDDMLKRYAGALYDRMWGPDSHQCPSNRLSVVLKGIFYENLYLNRLLRI